jgi:hypothetical protein
VTTVTDLAGISSEVTMNARRIALAAALFGVVFFAGTGAWAFIAPRSFYDTLATYPPYGRHLFHDIGAFQLGIAAGLVAGIARRRPMAVGLWGATVASIVHALSHWIDHDLGGRTTDPYLVTAVAVALVIGLVAAEVRER